MKTVTINGITFQTKKFRSKWNNNKTIFDLYKNPSSYKISAFNYWKDQLYCIHGIVGNSCTFSIYGSIKDENGMLRNVKITRYNNYITF